MEHFSSFREYTNFATAREFIYADPAKGDFKHKPNTLERLGGFLVAPLFTPADKFLTNINNPAVIAAMTASGLFLATLVYYPESVARVFDYAWAMHTGAYVLSQSAILGLGLRTLGRLSPEGDLLQAWDRKELVPVPIGAQILRN